MAFGEQNIARMRALQENLQGFHSGFGNIIGGLGQVGSQQQQMLDRQQRERMAEEQAKQDRWNRLFQAVQIGAGVAGPFISHGLGQKAAEAQHTRDVTLVGERERAQFENAKALIEYEYSPEVTAMRLSQGKAFGEQDLGFAQQKAGMEFGFRERELALMQKNALALQEAMAKLQADPTGASWTIDDLLGTVSGIEAMAYEPTGIYAKYFTRNPMPDAWPAYLPNYSSIQAAEGADPQLLVQAWRQKVLEEGEGPLRQAFDTFVAGSLDLQQNPELQGRLWELLITGKREAGAPPLDIGGGGGEERPRGPDFEGSFSAPPSLSESLRTLDVGNPLSPHEGRTPPESAAVRAAIQPWEERQVRAAGAFGGPPVELFASAMEHISPREAPVFERLTEAIGQLAAAGYTPQTEQMQELGKYAYEMLAAPLRTSPFNVGGANLAYISRRIDELMRMTDLGATRRR
jgi:hypothetical protein